MKIRYGMEYIQSIKISKYSSIDLIPNERITPNWITVDIRRTTMKDNKKYLVRFKNMSLK